jgi:hypothetical protein
LITSGWKVDLGFAYFATPPAKPFWSPRGPLSLSLGQRTLHQAVHGRQLHVCFVRS